MRIPSRRINVFCAPIVVRRLKSIGAKFLLILVFVITIFSQSESVSAEEIDIDLILKKDDISEMRDLLSSLTAKREQIARTRAKQVIDGMPDADPEKIQEDARFFLEIGEKIAEEAKRFLDVSWVKNEHATNLQDRYYKTRPEFEIARYELVSTVFSLTEQYLTKIGRRDEKETRREIKILRDFVGKLVFRADAPVQCVAILLSPAAWQLGFPSSFPETSPSIENLLGFAFNRFKQITGESDFLVQTLVESEVERDLFNAFRSDNVFEDWKPEQKYNYFSAVGDFLSHFEGTLRTDVFANHYYSLTTLHGFELGFLKTAVRFADAFHLTGNRAGLRSYLRLLGTASGGVGSYLSDRWKVGLRTTDWLIDQQSGALAFGKVNRNRFYKDLYMRQIGEEREVLDHFLSFVSHGQSGLGDNDRVDAIGTAPDPLVGKESEPADQALDRSLVSHFVSEALWAGLTNMAKFGNPWGFYRKEINRNDALARGQGPRLGCGFSGCLHHAASGQAGQFLVGAVLLLPSDPASDTLGAGIVANAVGKGFDDYKACMAHCADKDLPDSPNTPQDSGKPTPPPAPAKIPKKDDDDDNSGTADNQEGSGATAGGGEQPEHPQDPTNPRGTRDYEEEKAAKQFYEYLTFVLSLVGEKNPMDRSEELADIIFWSNRTPLPPDLIEEDATGTPTPEFLALLELKIQLGGMDPRLVYPADPDSLNVVNITFGEAERNAQLFLEIKGPRRLRDDYIPTVGWPGLPGAQPGQGPGQNPLVQDLVVPSIPNTLGTDNQQSESQR